MSQLDEMNRQLRSKGLALSPEYGQDRRVNFVNNGPVERPGFNGQYDPYQSSFAVTIGHSHSADLRSSF